VRAAFAGTPQFALPALAALAAHHELVGVLTQPDKKSGRGQQLLPSPVKSAALERQLPLAQPATLKSEEALATLRAWRPEVLVVVAYGLLLPGTVLALPRFGCINIHGSLLPRWRGAAPIQRAILAGDPETGVSIMRMEAGLDTGPVLLERRLPIAATDTSGSLHEALAKLGADCLLEALEGVERGTLEGRAQEESGATYAAKVQKSEARIDWRESSQAIDRRIRALNPWPVADTRLGNEPVKILAARMVSSSGDVSVSAADQTSSGSIVGLQDGMLIVSCGTGLLGVLRLQRPGRRPVSAIDFANAIDIRGRRFS
jgi:methionyl-tRNA formyltransferase